MCEKGLHARGLVAAAAPPGCCCSTRALIALRHTRQLDRQTCGNKSDRTICMDLTVNYIIIVKLYLKQRDAGQLWCLTLRKLSYNHCNLKFTLICKIGNSERWHHARRYLEIWHHPGMPTCIADSATHACQMAPHNAMNTLLRRLSDTRSNSCQLTCMHHAPHNDYACTAVTLMPHMLQSPKP
jgi:hypothetical protein